MNNIFEKLKKWYKSLEGKIVRWVEENEQELDYLGSYVLGVNGGYIFKWMDEWFYPNTWWARAFDKYWSSEPLRLTDTPSGANLGGPVRTRLVWSYDDDEERYYPFIPKGDGAGAWTVVIPREWGLMGGRIRVK